MLLQRTNRAHTGDAWLVCVEPSYRQNREGQVHPPKPHSGTDVEHTGSNLAGDIIIIISEYQHSAMSLPAAHRISLADERVLVTLQTKSTAFTNLNQFRFSSALSSCTQDL